MAKLYISFHLSNALSVLFPVHDWYLAQIRVISIMHVCIVCNLYLCRVCGSWKNSMWISFINGVKYNNVKLTYNIWEDKLWEALLHVMTDLCCHDRWSVTAGMMHFFCILPYASNQCFERKLGRRTYRFSWLFFDKRKSQKRCEGMLNQTCWRSFPARLSCHIPCSGVSADW